MTLAHGRTMKKLLALLILASWPVAQAQDPQKRHWAKRSLLDPLKDKKLWLGMVPLAVGMALDGRSTSVVMARCAGCQESNPIFGTRPSDKRLAITFTGMFVGQFYTTGFLKRWAEGTAKPTDSRFERRFWNHVWVAYPVSVGAWHGQAAAHNYRLACPSGSFKRPGLPGCVRR